MNGRRTYIAIIISAVLVISVGISLRIAERAREKSATAVSSERTKGGIASQSGTRKPNHIRRSEGPAELTDTQEEEVVDFDWRQVVRDKAKPPKLPRSVVEKYLERNNRNAMSLLAACRALGDTNYLQEAATNYPDDARVQLSVLIRDIFPEERRKWMGLFKTSSPDNSLANYLSALDYFGSSQSEVAINELMEATRKAVFKDYAMESRQEDEQLNLAAGRSPLESALSSSGWAEELLPELAKLKWLAIDNVARLEKQYLTAGDTHSAAQFAQIGLALANRFNNEDSAKFMIKQQVGMAIEALTLRELNQDTSYDFLGGKTPNERMTILNQQTESIQALLENFHDVYSNMTEAELLNYYDRLKLHGQEEAMRWFLAKQATR